MRITNNVTTVNNVTNVTNITRVTNVTIVAPPGATKNGRAFNTEVPAAPHLAAGRPALVQARAPEPVSTRPLPVYAPGSRPPELPHPVPMRPQPVNAAIPSAHPGEASSQEPGPLHAGPGTANAPQPAHPTPTAFGRDTAHAGAQPTQPERAYPGGYEHQQAPQAAGDHKAPPQPQNAQPQNAQPQNANHPAPHSQNAAPQSQSQHQNAAPQSQSQHQGGAAHGEGGKNEHDAKHGQGDEH
jgi:hypothetical protein